MSDTRVCNECFEEKPLDDFPFGNRNYERKPKCKLCSAMRKRLARRGEILTNIRVDRFERPPEMQGAGVPVFTPWVSKVRA